MSVKIGPKLLTSFLLLMAATPFPGSVYPQGKSEQQIVKEINEYREKRNRFFREHSRSPLDESQRENFKALVYYPVQLKYRFEGKIELYKYHIMNPEYYANFLTNKGIKKRYIRYGKFQFRLENKEYTMELYKSPGSDHLFIPFRDKTNENVTYKGGRYLDAEVIMPGYKTVIDFNMAYNPSCVYNEKYICIIPPDENNFEVEIRAGEKMFQQP